MPGFLLKAKGVLKKIGTAKTIKDSAGGAKEKFDGMSTGTKIMLAAGGCLFPIIFVLAAFIVLISFPFDLFNIHGAVNNDSKAFASTSSNSNSTSASEVVNIAREQIGKPYIWAAEGPDSFDCSGLVTYCYRQALSVEIPHWTISQMTDSHFQTVSSVDELSAGDIILDGGSSPSHVGIYTGEGTVIHAPTFGDHVREVPLEEFYGWVSGAETYRHYIG